MWDVFISHAAEDKDEVARPLAQALTAAGLSVWYDEFSLGLGDSLRRSIDRGLASSRYGVVIISPAFLAKEWPQRELDGLTVREVATRGTVVLPVWHRVGRVEVEAFSPTLADRLAVSTEGGIEPVVARVLQAVRGQAPMAGDNGTEGRRRRQHLRALLTLAGVALAGATGAVSWWSWRSARPATLSGHWRIDASARLPQVDLVLRMDGNRLSGTETVAFADHPDMVLSGLASQREVALADASADGLQFRFATRRSYRPNLTVATHTASLVHRYEGRLEGDQLVLQLQVEGGPLLRLNARRLPNGG